MMTRVVAFLLTFLGAVTLAACTSQQAMLPSQVAALRSGKLTVQPPPQKIEVLTKMQLFHLFPAEGLGRGPGGLGMLMTEQARERKAALKALEPYMDQMNFAPFPEVFLHSAQKAAIGIPWLRSSANPVSLSQSSKQLSGPQMEEITQNSGVNAVVFMSPEVTFSPDLRTLYVLADIKVYAHGEKTAIFLDGSGLIAASSLASTAPPLGSAGLEGIASSERKDDSAINARANVWFANDGARVKQAFESVDMVFECKLGNYLIGKRGTANPAKC